MVTFSYILMTLLMFLGLFLIGLILLQRGRGGGLAGAFGGMGGQSAFGTRAGDVFTKITIVVAFIWIVMCGVSVLALQSGNALSRVDKSALKTGEEAGNLQKAAPKDGFELPPPDHGALNNGGIKPDAGNNDPAEEVVIPETEKPVAPEQKQEDKKVQEEPNNNPELKKNPEPAAAEPTKPDDKPAPDNKENKPSDPKPETPEKKPQ